MSTFTKRVSSSADNGDERDNTTWFTDEAKTGNQGGFSWNGGFRFTNVTIPRGATITSAKLTYTAFNSNSFNAYAIVKGVAADNFSGFGSSNRPSQVAKTSHSANWTPSAFTANNTYDTPDLKDIIQEIIDRSGWASGQAIGLVVLDNLSESDAFRDCYSYGTNSSKAMLLTITYTYTAMVSVSDSISLSDSLFSIKKIILTLSDSVGLSESLATLRSYAINLSDTIGVGDSLSAFAQYVVSVSDSIGLSELLSSMKQAVISVADSLGLSELFRFRSSYKDKYGRRSNVYEGKYSVKGSQYHNKYSKRDSSYRDKY